MKEQTPPRLFHKLLAKMFSNTPMEEVEGDLLDDFQRNLNQYGTFKAKLYFMLDVIRLVRLVPRSRRNTQKSKAMNNLFLFHLKFSLRSIKKHKVYQSLNVASLTLGFTCFSLIYLFVFNQYQKDTFLKNPESIVRLNGIKDGKEGLGIHAGIPPTLLTDFPEIELMSRVASYDAEIFTPGAEETFQETVVSIEPSFIDIFQLEILSGNADLLSSNNVLISETMALKVFSDVNEAIGKELTILFNTRETKVLVSGIIKDLPINTSISANILKPLSINNNYTSMTGNMYMSFATFFKLKPGTDRDILAKKIPENLSRYTEVESLLNREYVFRTLSEIKADPKLSGGIIEAVDGQTLLIFKIVGLVILLLAVANYINLTTALTLKRTHEVGVKHMMGASTQSLIAQMMTESLIIGGVSILFSVLLVSSLLKSIEHYIGLELKIDPVLSEWLPVIGIGLLLAIVLLASIYPAILFSTSKFNEFFKGSTTQSPKSKWVRTGLMALQFSISAFLIVGSLTFLKQLQFINDSHKLDQLGNVVIVKGKIGDQLEVIKQRLNSLPEIDQISLASMIPGPADNNRGGMGTQDFEKTFEFYVIDENYLDIMGLKIVEGQNFFKDDRNDKNHVILNQAMIENAKEGHPLNKEYQLYGKEKSKVVGIVENFPIGSLKAEVLPTMYMQAALSVNLQDMLSKIAIKLNSDQPVDALKKIELVWQEVYPEQPFEVEFMHDRIIKIYTDEVKMGQLFGIFTTVALTISCLGIIGLLTYLIQVKLKEIGIRKVLGANFMTLASLLTLNIWKVLFLASLIAFPLSYYFLEDWLTSFVYRTQVSTELFILTMVFFVAIVGITVFWQIRNAVRMNPTEVLRNE